MMPLFSYSLVAALSAVLLVSNLVLVKGQICPGQRGRLHKSMDWILLSLFFCSALLKDFSQVFAVLSFIFLSTFLILQRKSKSKDSRQIILLYGASTALAVSFIFLLYRLNWQLNLLLIVQFFLLGACASHWVLVKARSRLQAFNRLLPIAGVIGAIFMTIILSLVAKGESQTAQEVVNSLLLSSGLMLTGFLFWVLPIIKNKTMPLWQISLVVLLELFASVTALSLSY